MKNLRNRSRSALCGNWHVCPASITDLSSISSTSAALKLTIVLWAHSSALSPDRVTVFISPPQPPDRRWRPSWGRTWTACWSSTCWAGRSTASRSSPPTALDPARRSQGEPRPVSPRFQWLCSVLPAEQLSVLWFSNFNGYFSHLTCPESSILLKCCNPPPKHQVQFSF